MAGCGKSTIGKLVASELDKKFVDLDCEIESRTGKTIPAIFEELGEEGFRRIEREVAFDVCLKGGQVIATGGGAVLDARNVEAMKSNGVVVWLKRDAHKLARDGRPLSKDLETVRALYNKREPIYRAVADLEVENNGTIKDCADKILQII